MDLSNLEAICTDAEMEELKATLSDALLILLNRLAA